MNKMNKKGFTLIEMLVVIAIIAVLVAIIVPTVSNATNKAKAAADAANMRSCAAKAAIEIMDKNLASGALVTYEMQSKLLDSTYKYIVCREEPDGVKAYYSTTSGSVASAKSLKDITDVADGTKTK